MNNDGMCVIISCFCGVFCSIQTILMRATTKQCVFHLFSFKHTQRKSWFMWLCVFALCVNYFVVMSPVPHTQSCEIVVLQNLVYFLYRFIISLILSLRVFALRYFNNSEIIFKIYDFVEFEIYFIFYFTPDFIY